jgi:putative aldouronate transport system permease protein
LAIKDGISRRQNNSSDYIRIRRSSIIHELFSNRVLYFMALPGLLFFAIFSYYPLFGLQIAFRDFNVVDGMWHSPFVGMKFFQVFLKSPFAFEVTFNTLYLNLLFMVTGLLVSVTIAILLNEITNNLLKRFMQSAMFLPFFLSWVIISALVYSFLNDKYGALNQLLISFGFHGQTWYNKPGLWRGILTFINTWQSFGYSVVIYLAAIISIDAQMYEAAKIDGANKFDEIFRITIPQLIPTAVLITLLGLGKIFYGNFAMIYSIIGDNGMLLRSTDIIDTYVFRAMRVQGDYSTATAVGLIQSVLGFCVVIIMNKLAKKWDDSMGLF